MKTTRLHKHAVVVLAAVISLALPATLQAQFLFTTNYGAITITEFTFPGRAAVIPDSTNGYPVTSIVWHRTTLLSADAADAVMTIPGRGKSRRGFSISGPADKATWF